MYSTFRQDFQRNPFSSSFQASQSIMLLSLLLRDAKEKVSPEQVSQITFHSSEDVSLPDKLRTLSAPSCLFFLAASPPCCGGSSWLLKAQFSHLCNEMLQLHDLQRAFSMQHSETQILTASLKPCLKAAPFLVGGRTFQKHKAREKHIFNMST